MHGPIDVAILIQQDCWLGSVHLMQELLAVAGTLQRGPSELATPALFRTQLVGRTMAPVASFTGRSLRPDASLRSAPLPAVIFLPSVFTVGVRRLELAPDIADWLRRAHARGAVLVALTSGVRLLGEAGLLDGVRVAVNPADREAMRNHYPAALMDLDSPLVVDGNIVSASSINPAVDACTFLVARFFGERVAAKFVRFANSARLPSYEQVALAVAPWRQHADQRVRQAQAYIERQFRQDLSVAEVAAAVAMSERSLARRFQAAAGLTPARYLARCRLEHGRLLLAQADLPLLSVALECGYNQADSFRRGFQELYGMSPAAYRRSLRR